MPRRKGSKNLKGRIKPWEKYGLSQAAYYNRLAKGLPLDAKLSRGRPKKKEEEKIKEMIKSRKEKKERKPTGRFSGMVYTNPPEKLEAIKQKYAGGITLDQITEMVNKFV